MIYQVFLAFFYGSVFVVKDSPPLIMPLVDPNANDPRILNSLIKTYKDYRITTFPKWTLPDYERLHNFYIYEQKMLSLLQDAELDEIAKGTETELPDDPNRTAAVNAHRKELFKLGNSIIYTLIHRTFNTQNKGLQLMMAERCG